ncbi:MAG TPA: AMP-binding protein [Pyrinomonadaceae bacterium]|jgi:long-chain acyl-CoA synthetase
MRKTILSFIEDCARANGGAAFAHRRGLRLSVWTGAQIAETANRFARELEARQIVKGDRVLFCAENSPEWVAAFFGCLLRGAVVVPLDVESRPEFIARVHEQTSARLLLYGSTARPPVDASLPALNLQELIAGACLRHPAEPYEPAPVAEEDIVEIIYTSGTTTEPKGVILTHANLLANLAPLEAEIEKYLKWERLVHPVRFLSLLPLSHVFGQFMGIFVPQLLGGEVFFQDALNPSEIISTVKRRRINVVVTVPRLLETLREKIERDQLAQGEGESFTRKLEEAEQHHFLRRWWAFRRVHRQFGWRLWAFISGGATLPAETESFWQRLGYAVVQGYGMTETASLVSVNHPFKQSRGSIGKTLPGQEVKLDAGGEIMVRGPNVSPGYWNGGGGVARDAEGWLRTGDVGELDEAGNLFFKGRKKDVIVTAAGLNIYPEDLEAALKAEPEVRDCVVVPFETSVGPEPFAAIIMRDESRDPAAAVERANARLSERERIRHWLVWPEPDFPRTPTQKVLRRKVAEALKARLSGGMKEARRAPGLLLETIGRLTGQARAELNHQASLAADLKLDSLGRIELLSALEDRYQVEIDEAAFTAATTVADIERMIQEGAQGQAQPYPYPEWARRAPVTWIRLAALYLFVLPLTRLMCWARTVGSHHLREVRGPVLFVSNHLTMVDHALILAALPGRFRRHLAIAMDGELLRGWVHPPAGTRWPRRVRLLAQYVLVVALFNVFPLPKKSGFRRSFAYAGEAVDDGQSVLVFPEGERSADGRLHPFMAGAGVLATELRAPVVPVKLKGLFKLKEQGRHFARPGEVSVVFGPPKSFSAREESARVAKELETRVAEL